MKNNKQIGLLLILLYFSFCLFFHEQAEIPFEWFVGKYGNANMSLLLNTIFGILTIVAFIYIYKKLSYHPHRKWMILLWIITFGLSYIAFYILMPYKSEGIHFIQYGIMGWLCLYALRKSWPAIMLAYILGIMDELSQYIWGGSIYIDFNDMILNFLGSALGILLYETLSGKAEISTKDTSFKLGWIIYSVILLSCLTFTLLYYLNIMCIYSDDGCNYFIMKGGRGSLHIGFWECTSWGKCWHRVKAWEGIILLPILPFISYFLFKYRVLKNKHV